jgi:hypothetical protein
VDGDPGVCLEDAVKARVRAGEREIVVERVEGWVVGEARMVREE